MSFGVPFVLIYFFLGGTVLLHTEVAISIRHIVCNPLITGVIRDVMKTFIAYLFSITTIVSNLHW